VATAAVLAEGQLGRLALSVVLRGLRPDAAAAPARAEPPAQLSSE
jgi:hypothetical protein